jgi:hypothetical protein
MDTDGTQSFVQWNVGEDHDRFVRTEHGSRFAFRTYANRFTRADNMDIPSAPHDQTQRLERVNATSETEFSMNTSLTKINQAAIPDGRWVEDPVCRERWLAGAGVLLADPRRPPAQSAVLAEGKHVSLNIGVEERDLAGVLRDGTMLSDELVEPLVDNRPRPRPHQRQFPPQVPTSC